MARCVVVSAYCLVLACGGALAAEEDDGEVIAALDAAVDQWLIDVEFVCTYQRTWGRAETLEQALAGKLAVDLKDQRVSGVFNKAFGLIRCSGDWESPPIVTGTAPDGSSTVTRMDFDEVSSPDLLLDYHPVVNPRNPNGSATFGTRDRAGQLDRFAAGMSSWRQVSPLAISGGEPGHYLKIPADAREASRSIVSSGEQRIVVLVSYDNLKVRTEHQVEFVLTGTAPVVEKITSIRRDTQTQKRRESVALASDFVECPGGPVARVVRYASNVPDPRHPGLPWSVREWRSDDLGARLPAREDFLVPIVENTRISPNNASIALNDGKLDLSQVTVKDLGTDKRPRPLATELSPPGGGWRRWLIWGSIALIVVSTAAVLANRFRHGHGA